MELLLLCLFFPCLSALYSANASNTYPSARDRPSFSVPTIFANSSNSLPSWCQISQPPLSRLQSAVKEGYQHPFSYYIPYHPEQDCDIYGPTCQTGIISLNVSLDACHSTLTRLPCSSYLRYQSQYLDAFQTERENTSATNLPPDWGIRFGRSPQCTSYMNASLSHEGMTFTQCATSDMYASFNKTHRPSQLPPGNIPFDHFEWEWPRMECCRLCFFIVQRVHVYYFPELTASDHCEKLGRRVGYVGSSNETHALPGFTVSSQITQGPRPTTAVIRNQTLYVTLSFFLSWTHGVLDFRRRYIYQCKVTSRYMTPALA